MKRLLLAGPVFLGVVALGAGARATVFDFTYSGSIINFAIPASDIYQILALGAQGGSGSCFAGPFTCPNFGAGGRGAEVVGNFSLSAGEMLQIAVGGEGGAGNIGGGGGGGGSFVVGPGDVPLIIAGGGGGGGASFTIPLPGQGGLAGSAGGGGGALLNGGTGGNGGGDGGFTGGGGGTGFLSAGSTDLIVGGGGGHAFPDLAGGSAAGGGAGGFGGGGGGSRGAGGGGGYSGGGGGGGGNDVAEFGGGGGSFDAGIEQILLADFQTGNGEVIITQLIPEPASIGLLGVGLVGLSFVWRGRRPEI